MIQNVHRLLILSCFLSLLISLIMTPFFRRIAFIIGAVDSPSQYRKIHSDRIPRLGGPSIFLSYFGSLYLTALLSNQGLTFLSLTRTKIEGLLWGSIVILIIGLFDDIRGVRPLFKVLGILLAAVIAFYFGFQIKIVNTPFGVMHFRMMSFPITAFWLLFASNAINLIDGIDGLATGVTIAASTTIFALYVISGNLINAILITSLFGACLGFLVYNYHPASIFLGDSGSLLLGFLLGNTMLLGSYRHAAVGFAIPLIIFALPIADTTLAVLRRWARRMPISSADREHIHHRLLDIGLTQVQAVAVLWGFTIYFGVIAILVSLCKNIQQVVIVAFLSLALLSIFLILKWGDRIKLMDLKMVTKRIKHDFRRTKQRSHNWELINSICNEIKYIKSEHQLSACLQKAFAGLDLDSGVIVTTIPSLLNPKENFTFQWKRTSNSDRFCDLWTARLTITVSGRIIGTLFVTKQMERSDLPDDITECLRELRNAISFRLVPDQAILPWSKLTNHQKSGVEMEKFRTVLFIQNPYKTIDLSSLQNNLHLNLRMETTDNPIKTLEKLNLLEYNILIINYSSLLEALDKFISFVQSQNPSIRIIVLDCPSNSEIEKLFEKGIIGFSTNNFSSEFLLKIIETVE